MPLPRIRAVAGEGSRARRPTGPGPSRPGIPPCRRRTGRGGPTAGLAAVFRPDPRPEGQACSAGDPRAQVATPGRL